MQENAVVFWVAHRRNRQRVSRLRLTIRLRFRVPERGMIRRFRLRQQLRVRCHILAVPCEKRISV